MIIRVWYNNETISRQMQIQGGGEDSEGKKYGMEKEIQKKGMKKGGKGRRNFAFFARNSK